MQFGGVLFSDNDWQQIPGQGTDPKQSDVGRTTSRPVAEAMAGTKNVMKTAYANAHICVYIQHKTIQPNTYRSSMLPLHRYHLHTYNYMRNTTFQCIVLPYVMLRSIHTYVHTQIQSRKNIRLFMLQHSRICTL